MDALFLVHSDQSPPGTFGLVAHRLGWRVEEVRPHLGEALPALDGFDALLVCGGPQHLYEPSDWLAAEEALLRAAVARELPTLGICLGAQLLSKALGGAVTKARQDERGWFPIELDDEGAADELLSALPRRLDAFEWHWDTYSIPDGGVELARSAHCEQALRIGRRAWGVQFHPEVTLETMEQWARAKQPLHPDPEALIADCRRLAPDWKAHGTALAERFFELAADR
jgi:GMP synthase-like glutamine amidotransferase